ncbi:LOW QUALITY PROTEIN: receptor-like protein 12 [Momordica charantia]|uniref:LOW QUALITY PROTEIN: receptor-like protein 12 n=1 Tax=Momordica charantia TaxID=3673 RepID=A0A6J1CV26_MOMCH|nr:LOW QUALITY PROTEIN: receptor-like protein 12 [Momordica charantia]
MALLMYHLTSFFLLFLCYSLVNSYHPRDPKESLALLEFKKVFSLNESASSACDFWGQAAGYPKTATWNETEDCCSWDGVKCDEEGEGHVVGLDISCSQLYGTLHPNSTLFALSHLRTLNLSFNSFDFSPLSPQFGTFRNLRVLDLSSSSFHGDVPIEISHLSNLVSLDLSGNYDLKFSNLVMNQLVHNLTNLRNLALARVDLSRILTLTSFMNFSLSLTSLRLSSCGLSGNFPSHVLSLPNLRVLQLDYNHGLKGHLPMSNWSKSLEILDLFQERFPIPLAMPSYKVLDLSWCQFTGGIPESIKNLTQLDTIGLSRNNLLIGVIPSWLYALPHLKNLALSNNHFINAFMGDFKSNSLEVLDLGETNLQGGISESIYRQANLEFLILSSNNLSGILNLDILLRIQSLEYLFVSNNNQLSIPCTNASSRNIIWIEMASLKVEKFPCFLRYQKNLKYLDLSNNQLRGEIPRWFSEFGDLYQLNLSHNFLSSGIEVLFTLSNLGHVSLDFNLFNKLPSLTLPPLLSWFTASNNQLSGNIHHSIFWQTTNLKVLDLSNNSLSGEIPPLICHVTYLGTLILSKNRLSGTIPSCLGGNTSLEVLDLQSNNLSGTLPTNFPTGSQLKSFNLNDNQIEGELPRSLLNCENLHLLDLGNNKITGNFPYWLEAASNLQVLILRSNRFYGPINNSMNQYSFPSIQIIDLSRNHFIGSLPSNLFENLRAMKEIEMGNQKPNYISIYSSSYYHVSVVVSMKGLDHKLERILSIFKAIDLSSNDFSGEIPKSIGMLISLKGFNLSHNKLTGGIPMSFGNLTSLEWLDLSSNKLSCNIPLQLVALTFLSVLNLSHNQLSGPIPQGKQFATFENSSYIGNLGLCGFPLPNCDAKKHSESQLLRDDEEDEILEKGFWWRVVFMGYGCGMVFGIFVGYMVFRIGKPLWIVAMVEGKRSPKIQRSRRRNFGPRNRND